MSDTITFDLEWMCSGCGVASPEKRRSCDCPTDSLYKLTPDGLIHGVKQAALARPAAVPAEAIRALAERWLTDADAAEYATDRLGEKFRERCEAIAGTRRVCASALLRLLGGGE